MSGDAGAGERLQRLPWWAALLCAAVGGFLLDVASPELAWWPASFIGCALALAGAWQQRAGFGALVGAVAGAAFWLPHISWLTLYLGPVPWLGASAVMILWYALLGLAVALATRGLAVLLRAHPAILTLAQSLTAAGLWVLREQVQGLWPYDGFSWGRLAHMQANGPLLESVSWLGLTGLGGAVAFACALPVAAAMSAGRRRVIVSLGGALAVLLVLALVPPATASPDGALRVAAVQGNSKSGIFDDRESGDVLDDHVRATTEMLDRLESRGERVDVIVWPENSAEFGLPDHPLSAQRVAMLARRAEAPIVVGSVLEDPDGSYTNSSLVWGPDGGTGERYDKRYPVPFAEYMPSRAFFHALAPELVDLVQLDYRAGTRAPAVDVETADGVVRAGLAICFDITFDEQAVAMVDAGAQVIFAQTNNADFGRTDENEQQLAIARLRAVEMGRAVVNISTVGTSAIVGADGGDIADVPPYTAGSMVAEVPLSAERTPALRFGAAIAAAWMLCGGIGLGAGFLALIRHARAAPVSRRRRSDGV